MVVGKDRDDDDVQNLQAPPCRRAPPGNSWKSEKQQKTLVLSPGDVLKTEIDFMKPCAKCFGTKHFG